MVYRAVAVEMATIGRDWYPIRRRPERLHRQQPVSKSGAVLQDAADHCERIVINTVFGGTPGTIRLEFRETGSTFHYFHLAHRLSEESRTVTVAEPVGETIKA